MKFIKRIAILGLTLTVIAGLTACGKSGDASQDTGRSDGKKAYRSLDEIKQDGTIICRLVRWM